MDIEHGETYVVDMSDVDTGNVFKPGVDTSRVRLTPTVGDKERGWRCDYADFPLQPFVGPACEFPPGELERRIVKEGS